MSDKFRMFDILDVDMGGWWLSLSLGTQCLHQNRDETWSSDPGASMYKLQDLQDKLFESQIRMHSM